MIIFEKTVKLEDYHPSTVKDSYEFKELAKSENPEFKILYDAFNEIFSNKFIAEATEYGIAQWERILDLYPHDEDTLDNRREAIELALLSQLPYTYIKLQEILDGLCGSGGYQVELTPNNYSIKILVSLGSKRSRGIVTDTMEQVLPKNLIYTVDLLYNRHIDLEPFTHEYMERWTHEDLIEEVLQ